MCVHPRACPSYFWSHFEYFMFNQCLFSSLIPLYRAVMYTWYPVCIASLLKQHVLRAESHPAIDKLPPSNLGALCKLFMCVCRPSRSTALITYLSDRCNDVCIVNVCLISFSFLGFFFLNQCLMSRLRLSTFTNGFDILLVFGFCWLSCRSLKCTEGNLVCEKMDVWDNLINGVSLVCCVWFLYSSALLFMWKRLIFKTYWKLHLHNSKQSSFPFNKWPVLCCEIKSRNSSA